MGIDQVQQITAAKKFVERWQAAEGNEQRESNKFWIEFMQLLGVANPTYMLDFERKVQGKRIDVFYEDMGVLIENKSRGIDLDAPEQRGKNRDGSPRMVTPYEQARWYADNIVPRAIAPKWIVTCNFDQIRIYDLDNEKSETEYETVLLEEVPQLLYRFAFLTKKENSRLEREKDLSVKAGVVVGKLYDAFSKRYHDIENDHAEQRSLNMLITRIVFLLYAEDAGLFERQAFYSYLKGFPTQHMAGALRELFKVLKTPDGRGGLPDERAGMYLADDLAAFPYVNGGLFEEDILIPQFDDRMRFTLLQEASAEFDWSKISPTIFGAVFESTLNPETRRAGGMHYTSIESIHKVTGPLFYDELKDELTAIEGMRNVNERNFRLRAFREKLGKIKVLDPACGSGNFLTETYLSLRKLENRVLTDLYGEQTMLLPVDPIEVTVDQFFGIEINDFAVEVAKTALWIAELQMLHETREIMNMWIDELPLKSNDNIHCANALRIDWNDVLPAAECDYVIGNPPFLGYSNQNAEQKQEMLDTWLGANGKPIKQAGKIDYVSAWHYRTSEYMVQGNGSPRAAFVSTNSITQGDQVAPIWSTLKERFGTRIDFAWRTYVWNSEAVDQAHVHVVVVGFSVNDLGCHSERSEESPRPQEASTCNVGDSSPSAQNDGNGKGQNDGEGASRNATGAGGVLRIFGADGDVHVAGNINGYLADAPDVFVSPAKKSLCGAPAMHTGNRPADGGHLIIEDADRDTFLAAEPQAAPFVRPFLGSKEFINGLPRWCLWLVDVTPEQIARMPRVAGRVEACRQDRLAAPDEGRRKLAAAPHLFREQKCSDHAYLVVPKVSSERRAYVPIGYVGPETICSDLLFIVPDGGLYEFGVLTSHAHNAWMRTVGGRLKSDYRYSQDLVYNTFPWPNMEDSRPRHPEGEARRISSVATGEILRSAQDDEHGIRGEIERFAQAVLDTRDNYPDKSLADLYDPDKMPSDLRQAHQDLDSAVEVAYGVNFGGDEEKIVAHLFKLYAEATKGEQ